MIRQTTALSDELSATGKPSKTAGAERVTAALAVLAVAGLIPGLGQAADLPDMVTIAPPPAAMPAQDADRFAVFGEFTIGAEGAWFNVDIDEDGTQVDDVVIPKAYAGGKIAFSHGHGFGVQLDGNVGGFDVNWVSPMVPVDDGSFIDASGAAHLTYTVNDQFKLGAYGYIRHERFSLDDDDFSFGTTVNKWAVGGEAMFKPGTQTTLFARAGYLDPYFGSIDISGPVDVHDTETNSPNHVFGYSVGGGVRHDLGPNWTLGADIDLSSLDIDLTATSLDAVVTMKMLAVEASIAHHFNNHPLTVIGSLGYLHTTFNSDSGSESISQDGYTAKVHLRYSFGQNQETVDRTLFILPM